IYDLNHKLYDAYMYTTTLVHFIGLVPSRINRWLNWSSSNQVAHLSSMGPRAACSLHQPLQPARSMSLRLFACSCQTESYPVAGVWALLQDRGALRASQIVHGERPRSKV